MANDAMFWDKIADRYAQMPISDEAAYQQKLAITREYLKPNAQVLEFACGTGGTALAHAPYVQQIDAIDISARMIEFCEQKRLQAGIDNVRFEQNTIENLQPSAEGYDVVLGMSILHLVVNHQFVIDKVFSLLKPGGLFISSTICLADAAPWFRFIAPIGRWLGKMPEVHSLHGDELEQSFCQAGFVIEQRWRPNKRAAEFFIVRRPA